MQAERVPLNVRRACGAAIPVNRAGLLPRHIRQHHLGLTELAGPRADHFLRAQIAALDPAQLAAELRVKARTRAERFSWQATAKGWKHAIERAITERSG